MPVPPTLGVATNWSGFHGSWNMSCITVHSSLLISAYMWNISTWSTKCLVSHHLKGQILAGRGQNRIPYCGTGAPRSAFSFLLGAELSASLDVSSWSGLLTSIGRTVSDPSDNWGILPSIKGPLTTPLPEHIITILNCSLNYRYHTGCHQGTLHAWEAPREVNLSNRVFNCACSFSVHSRSMRCAFPFGVQTNGVWLSSFDSDHLLVVQGFAICIIWCAASCWASSSSVPIACIKLFTATFNSSAPCF